MADKYQKLVHISLCKQNRTLIYFVINGRLWQTPDIGSIYSLGTGFLETKWHDSKNKIIIKGTSICIPEFYNNEYFTMIIKNLIARQILTRLDVTLTAKRPIVESPFNVLTVVTILNLSDRLFNNPQQISTGMPSQITSNIQVQYTLTKHFYTTMDHKHSPNPIKEFN